MIVLNELPTAAMSAVNAALRPQRSLAAFLMKSLPTLLAHLQCLSGASVAIPPPIPASHGYGPLEGEAIGWKIAAMCFDWDAAVTTISGSIGLRNSALARRITAAAEHFVKSAVFEASSNREVVGGTRYQQQGDKRVKVTVPPLKCFAIRAAGSGGQVVNKMTGVREVVHKARLDEVAKYQLTGVQKGFNEHLGDQDCQFEWGQLGCLSRTGLFVSLGIE